VAEAPRVARLEDLPALAIVDGTITWRPVRRELGIGAFGINAYTAARAGDDLIEEHDETGPGAGRHEELYVVMAGAARFTVDGREIDAPAGTFVFLPDPASRRKAIAVADGTTAVAIGGAPGEPYVISPWESGFIGSALLDAGDPEGAVAAVREAVEQDPEHAMVLYNAACIEARAGHHDEAVAHLRRAAELEAEHVRQWADGDTDLDPIRDRADWPL
jgi:tetratricopeptide (TPR) repeat protein